MLEAGGNAADAAAAAAFTLTVVEPFGSGLGGGGVALVRMANDEAAMAYNYRVTAAALANYDTVDFSDRSSWAREAIAACTPGTTAGVLAMHEAHGKLPRAQIMAPAIRAAREGYPAGPTLCMLLADSYDAVASNDETASIFLPNGFPPEPGQIMRNPDLANVLEAIAADGASAFYSGPIAEALAAGIEAEGGLLRVGDFEAYEPAIGPAVRDTYRGLTLECSPPPFAGFAVLETLSLLEPFDLSAMEYPSSDAIELFAAAMWISSRDYRVALGDPRYVDVQPEGFLTDEYAAENAPRLRGPIDRAEEEVAINEASSDAYGSTTHLSVIDAEGSAVSLTQTLGLFFGCTTVPPGTGVLFNNQMQNFTGSPGLINSLNPGRRPRSSQAPTIITREGEIVAAVGSPGNYRIVTTVPLVISQIVDFGMTPEQAMDAPRIAIRQRSSAPNQRDPLELEGGIPEEIGSAMESLGYRIGSHGPHDLFFGGVHAVWVDSETGERTAVADPRRDGVARAQ
jgi:gamma-glutamyltranspeptidase/glutathione hydrolase